MPGFLLPYGGKSAIRELNAQPILSNYFIKIFLISARLAGCNYMPVNLHESDMKILVMGKFKLKASQIKQTDFPSSVAKSIAIQILDKHYKRVLPEEKIKQVHLVLKSPEAFLEDEVWSVLAKKITTPAILRSDYDMHQLKHQGVYQVFGERLVDNNAIRQMNTAMCITRAVAGALMPDAHQGYGLPIGAVYAMENAVMPYGVGMDIGCRMSLSIYDVPGMYWQKKQAQYERALRNHTHFGNEGGLEHDVYHEILDSPVFSATPLLRRLHTKAWEQLGSSGTGNHFVEFGEVEIPEHNTLGLTAGSYLGLLSHSGSRGFGAFIAGHYSKIARMQSKLPPSHNHLSWLDLNTESGEEYWLSMNLAGNYAKACHDVIHSTLERVLGLKRIFRIENHHNFAWKEEHLGKTLVVHRKGATPAAEGVLGIIPGSMNSKAYIVRGKGNEASLHSASHGAGRKMSRREATEKLGMEPFKKSLRESGVTLIGGSIEECPAAYKNIDTVMDCQQELVSVEGSFLPKLVRMNRR